MNKLAKDFRLQEKEQVKASDKVPEHAKLVVDDEKLAKEALDLRRRLKELSLENAKVASNVQTLETRKREKEAALDRVVREKRLVSANGELKLAQRPREQPLALEPAERENPLDPVVRKIEAKGVTVQQAFDLFDADGDEVLTLQEIKQGIKNQGIALLDSELQELVKQLDSNTDGVVTLAEWLRVLQPRYEAEREFRRILQDVADVEDPLDLEERILDLRFKGRRLERELELLRAAGRPRKDPAHRRLAEKLLGLEARL